MRDFPVLRAARVSYSSVVRLKQLLHVAASRLRNFRRALSGSVAVLFAFMLVALCLCVGAGIDVARWFQARSQTIAAMDAAALAGGRVLQLDETDVSGAKDAAQKFYAENVRHRLEVFNDTITFNAVDENSAFAASGNAYIKTPFLAFAHIPELPLFNSAVATYSKAVLATGGSSKGSVEISMILDVTGSMAGSKIADLKIAANDLVGIVLGTDKDKTRVAVVPYANAVNVGGYAVQVRGSIANGTCNNPGCKRFRFQNAIRQSLTHDISTCVSERTGTDAYTDAAPASAAVGTNYPSPNNPCLTNEIVPLTNDKTLLETQIDALLASGSTGGHIGVAWGWYLLSPNWGSVFPAASTPVEYGSADVQKIAILMTDGEYNSAYCKGVISKDSTEGSGYIGDHIDCNAPNGHSFDQSISLCANMKAAGIKVYTVGFDVVDDQRARDLMTQCATAPQHVYMASDGEQLKQAFRDIALKISTLHLAQ